MNCKNARFQKAVYMFFAICLATCAIGCEQRESKPDVGTDKLLVLTIDEMNNRKEFNSPFLVQFTREQFENALAGAERVNDISGRRTSIRFFNLYEISPGPNPKPDPEVEEFLVASLDCYAMDDRKFCWYNPYYKQCVCWFRTGTGLPPRLGDIDPDAAPCQLEIESDGSLRCVGECTPFQKCKLQYTIRSRNSNSPPENLSDQFLARDALFKLEVEVTCACKPTVQ